MQLYTFLETSLVTLSLLPHFISFFSEGEIPGTPGTLATTFLAFGMASLTYHSDLCNRLHQHFYVINGVSLLQFWIWHLHWVYWGFWSCTYRWCLLIPQPLRYCSFLLFILCQRVSGGDWGCSWCTPCLLMSLLIFYFQAYEKKTTPKWRYDLGRKKNFEQVVAFCFLLRCSLISLLVSFAYFSDSLKYT